MRRRKCVFDEEIFGDFSYKKHETAVEKLNALVSPVNIDEVVSDMS